MTDLIRMIIYTLCNLYIWYGVSCLLRYDPKTECELKNYELKISVLKKFLEIYKEGEQHEKIDNN